ncbi:uncharacterized protein [Euwallacea similis]|uniref:uncharacterized protein n=1 Tax=Euwallacea similis TaxID=1736056 RepID=UPI00344BEAEB
MACKMIGTGNRNLEKLVRNEGASKTIAKDIVLEIVANALDITDNNTMTRIPAEPFKKVPVKKKPLAQIRGIGDQRSNETLEAQETIIHSPRARKKNRLTDLAENSKQVISKMISSECKASPYDEKKDQKKLVELTDVVYIKDEPFQSKYKERPEKVSLPKGDTNENMMTKPASEKLMGNVNLDPTKEDSVEKKRMTFPRATGSRAKTVFMAKCRTLKKEAINFNKKKWDVGGRIVNFFKKKKGSQNGEGSKSQQSEEMSDLEENGSKYEGQ